MSFSSTVLAALERLGLYNGGTYNAQTNPHGFAGIGYLTEIPNAYNDMGAVAQAVADEVQGVSDAVTETGANRTAVAADRTAVQTLRNETETFRNQAEASATSTQFPVVNGGGTATAYTASIPGFVLTDGASFRLNLPATSGNAPTLNVNASGAKGMVAEDGRAPVGGEMLGGYTVIVTYEASTNKWIVTGLPRSKWAFDVDANGKRLKNLMGWNRQITYLDALAQQSGVVAVMFNVPCRLYTVRPVLTDGSATLQLFKNFSAILFNPGNTSTLSVTTTATDYTPSAGFIDFAAGDILRLNIPSVNSASNLSLSLETMENYAA